MDLLQLERATTRWLQTWSDVSYNAKRRLMDKRDSATVALVMSQQEQIRRRLFQLRSVAESFQDVWHLSNQIRSVH